MKARILVVEDLLDGNNFGLNVAGNSQIGCAAKTHLRRKLAHPDRSHDSDDVMFFDRERTGVELHAKDCHVWNIACPDFTNGEAHELRYELFTRGATQHSVKVPRASNHGEQTEPIYT